MIEIAALDQRPDLTPCPLDGDLPAAFLRLRRQLGIGRRRAARGLGEPSELACGPLSHVLGDQIVGLGDMTAVSVTARGNAIAWLSIEATRWLSGFK